MLWLSVWLSFLTDGSRVPMSCYPKNMEELLY